MNNRTILCSSFIASLLFLILERLVGIDIYFHPDANTYLTTSGLITAEIIRNPIYLFNHGYYLWTYFLGLSPTILILANMLIYSLTNLFLHKAYIKHVKRWTPEGLIYKKLHYLVYLIFIFNLYRLHLSVHILKDTIIIFTTVLLLTGATKLKVFWLIPVMVFRLFGVTYLVLFLKGRPLYLLVFTVLIASYLFQELIYSFLIDFNEAEMDFREGTSIPSFQDSGIVGIFLRMLLWPLLMLSGIFVLISPSPLYAPIALSSFVLQWWSFAAVGRPAYTIRAFALLAVLAALVPGFTSYQRYCLPIITLLPILILSARNSRALK